MVLKKSHIAGAAMVLLPFIFSGGPDGIRTTKSVVMVAIGIIVGSYYLSKYIRNSFGYCFGILGLSAVYSGYGILQSSSLGFCIAAILTCLLVHDINEAGIYRFLHYLSISGAFCALHGYFQMFGYSPLITYVDGFDTRIPIGFMGQQTLYGPFVCASFVAALFAPRWKLRRRIGGGDRGFLEFEPARTGALQRVPADWSHPDSGRNQLGQPVRAVGAAV